MFLFLRINEEKGKSTAKLITSQQNRIRLYLRQIHNRHGSSVQNAELDGRSVDVPELPHLVGERVGVLQPDGRGEGEGAVEAADALGAEAADDGGRAEVDRDPVAGVDAGDRAVAAPAELERKLVDKFFLSNLCRLRQIKGLGKSTRNMNSHDLKIVGCYYAEFVLLDEDHSIQSLIQPRTRSISALLTL